MLKYGFRVDESGVVFEHPFFRRNDPMMLAQIKRIGKSKDLWLAVDEAGGVDRYCDLARRQAVLDARAAATAAHEQQQAGRQRRPAAPLVPHPPPCWSLAWVSRPAQSKSMLTRMGQHLAAMAHTLLQADRFAHAQAVLGMLIPYQPFYGLDHDNILHLRQAIHDCGLRWLYTLPLSRAMSEVHEKVDLFFSTAPRFNLAREWALREEHALVAMDLGAFASAYGRLMSMLSMPLLREHISMIHGYAGIAAMALARLEGEQDRAASQTSASQAAARSQRQRELGRLQAACHHFEASFKGPGPFDVHRVAFIVCHLEALVALGATTAAGVASARHLVPVIIEHGAPFVGPLNSCLRWVQQHMPQDNKLIAAAALAVLRVDRGSQHALVALLRCHAASPAVVPTDQLVVCLMQGIESAFFASSRPAYAGPHAGECAELVDCLAELVAGDAHAVLDMLTPARLALWRHHLTEQQALVLLGYDKAEEARLQAAAARLMRKAHRLRRSLAAAERRAAQASSVHRRRQLVAAVQAMQHEARQVHEQRVEFARRLVALG